MMPNFKLPQKRKLQMFYEKFKCIDETDYRGGYTLKDIICSNTMKYLFLESLKKMNKNKEGSDNVDDITEFKIPPEYFKALRVGTKESLKKLKAWVEEDGAIRILTMEIADAVYWKEGDNWNITIGITGQYIEK